MAGRQAGQGLTQRELKGSVLFSGCTSALADRVKESRLQNSGPAILSILPEESSTYRLSTLTSPAACASLHACQFHQKWPVFINMRGIARGHSDAMYRLSTLTSTPACKFLHVFHFLHQSWLVLAAFASRCHHRGIQCILQCIDIIQHKVMVRKHIKDGMPSPKTRYRHCPE